MTLIDIYRFRKMQADASQQRLLQSCIYKIAGNERGHLYPDAVIYIKISDLQVEVVSELIFLHRRTPCKIASLVGLVLVRGARGPMTAVDP